MKIYTGLDFTSKWEHIIKQCIQQAKENPFTTYYIVVKDPLLMEEVFLNYTDTLFNIEILTLSTLITKHIHTNVVDRTKKIIILKEILENNSFTMFYQPDTIFETIDGLLTIFDIFYNSNVTTPNSEGMTTLSKEKIQTCFSLYQQFLFEIQKEYQYSILDALSNLSLQNQVFYIMEDCIANTRAITSLQHLSKHNTIYIIANYEEDNRVLQIGYQNYFKDFSSIPLTSSNPFTNYLTTTIFSNETSIYSKKHPFSLLIETTPKEEINSICFDIFSNIVEKQMSYQDFAIYYPNSEYLELLQQTLTRFSIPYNTNSIPKENPIYKVCKDLLYYALQTKEIHLLSLLDSLALKKCSSFQQVNYYKKQWLETNTIINDSYLKIKSRIQEKYLSLLTTSNTIASYSQIIINFIQEEVIQSEDSIALLAFFTTLKDYQNTITLIDYSNLITMLAPTSKETIATPKDHVYLLNHQQCYSGLLKHKKIYILGMNETIVPTAIKDQGFLLNIEMLGLGLHPTISEQLSLQQNSFLKILTTKNSDIIFSYAMTSTTNDTLLPSSFLLHLQEIFTIPKISVDSYYAHPALIHRLYLNKGLDTNRSILNTSIDIYKQTSNQPENIDGSIFGNTLSASQLETYNGCPYKYYCQYGLQIQPFNQPLLQANEIGTLVHHVLETSTPFFKNREQAKQQNETAIKDHVKQTIEKYLEDTILLKNKLHEPLNRYFITCIKEDLYNTIVVLQYHMQVSSFHVASTEEKVYDNYGSFNLKGFVDRMDVFSNYIKVIDYKSSNKDLDFSLALQGFNIQMLLYIDMLSKDKQLQKGALLYFNTKKRILKSTLSIKEEELPETFIKEYKMNGYIVDEVVEDIDQNITSSSNIIKAGMKKDGSYKGNVINESFFSKLIDEVGKHIYTLYQEITKGNIAITPKGSNDPTIHTKVNPCSYCPYRAICNLDVFYNTSTLVEKLEVDTILGGEENA